MPSKPLDEEVFWSAREKRTPNRSVWRAQKQRGDAGNRCRLSAAGSDRTRAQALKRGPVKVTVFRDETVFASPKKLPEMLHRRGSQSRANTGREQMQMMRADATRSPRRRLPAV